MKRVVSSTDISDWEKLDSKSVPDLDGFYTDFTLYKQKGAEYYVCILGDSDMYDPDNADPEWETESREEAIDFFEGFDGCIE